MPRMNKTEKAAALEYIVTTTLDVDKDDPIMQALKLHGYVQPIDIMNSGDATLEALDYRDSSGNVVSLRTNDINLVKLLRDFMSQELCVKKRNSSTLADWKSFTAEEFDTFRVSPGPLPPTGPTPGPAPIHDPLRDWSKGVKRDPAQFPTLKREDDWPTYQPDLITTATVQEVEEVLNPGYNPPTTDAGIFQKKQTYMTSVFRATWQTDQGKAIISQHQDKHDAHNMYAALVRHQTKSTKAELTSEELMDYLISSKINDGKWRGTTESYILHWHKQLRQYNKVSPAKFVDAQAATMLSSAIKAIPDLRAVKTTARQLRSKGSGTAPAATFQDYLDLLISAAQEYDKTLSKSPRRRRQVYTADAADPAYLSSEDADAFYDAEASYEVNVHGFDTPLYELNAQQQQPPRSSRMLFSALVLYSPC